MKELFELNTPDCVSSMGRTPQSGKSVSYFKAKVTEQGVDTYDNPWNKWGNRGSIGVFKDTTNLISDPEDMTTGNWNAYLSTISLSDYYIQGRRFSKIIKNTTDVWSNAYQVIAGLSIATPSIVMTIRNGDVPAGKASRLRIYDSSAATVRWGVTITWSTKTVTAVLGTLVSAKWFGDDIVEVLGVATGVVTGNVNWVMIYPNTTDTVINTIYATAVQIEDSTYPTPYTSTSRAAGAFDYSKSMPNQGTIECWVRPWFDADTAVSGRVFSWALDALHRLQLWYYAPSNAWTVIWRNGAAGTSRYLNGTTVYTNATLWNWIHLKVWWNISAGTGGLAVNGSTEDATWSGALDAFTTPIETLAIGFEEYTDVSHFDGLITDFAFKDTVDTSTTHYDSGRPYYEQGRLLGKNCNWRLG